MNFVGDIFFPNKNRLNVKDPTDNSFPSVVFPRLKKRDLNQFQNCGMVAIRNFKSLEKNFNRLEIALYQKKTPKETDGVLH